MKQRLLKRPDKKKLNAKRNKNALDLNKNKLLKLSVKQLQKRPSKND